MTVLRVMASRHSAFYSPLLGAIAGGFLRAEGFDPVYSPLPGMWLSSLIAFSLTERLSFVHRQ